MTKRKIRIETVPTAHDLRERRLELLRASLEESLGSGQLERYRALVETLASEHDVMDLAAAAIKLADQERGDAEKEDVHIPTASIAPAAPNGKVRGKAAGPRLAASDAEKIYIGLGRSAGIRPADLVGAIANEAGIPARSIGAIDITDRFSLVEVPAAQIEQIIASLRATMIRGKKINARRDRPK